MSDLNTAKEMIISDNNASNSNRLTAKDAVALPRIARVDLSPERPLAVHIEKLPCDGRIHSHLHLALEVGVVLSGHIVQNQGDGWFDLRAGHAWSCRSLEVHRWRVVRPAVELRFDLLPSQLTRMPNFDGFDPAALFRSSGRSRALGSKRILRNALKELAGELEKKYEQEQSLGQVYIDLIRLLECLAEEVREEASKAPSSMKHPVTHSHIQAAFELIENSPERRVSVAEGASVCGMAKSTFSKIFKEITGLGFGEFALHSRLERVAHALKNTDFPLKLLASELGFRDESHLNRAFVARYGVTPGCYRSSRLK